MVYLWVPRSVEDPDIWWHLRNAELQLSSHAFLTHDLYSFTAGGAPWINHEWLAEVPFYLGWRILGENGIYLVTVIAVESILLGVFYLAYKKSRNIAATMIVSVVAALISTVSFGPRTLLFGWICLVLELLLFEQLLVGMRYVWMLPLLFICWVNLHGSWVIGLVLLAIFVACASIPLRLGLIDSLKWPRDQAKRLMIWSCLSVCALFVNPYGWRLVAYPFDLAFRQKLNIGTVEEWKSLDFHTPRGKAFLLVLAALFVMQLYKAARWTLYELAFVMIGIYAALTYSRFLFLSAILIMPILAKYLPVPFQASEHRHVSWLGVLVLLSSVAIVIRRSPMTLAVSHHTTSYPFHALPYLRDFQPQGRVFNDFLWGGFLEWNTHQLPTFIDSRIDIFERNGTFKDYLDVTGGKSSLEILDKYQIRYVLFEESAPLTYILRHSGRWKVDYSDGTTILLEKINAGHAGEL